MQVMLPPLPDVISWWQVGICNTFHRWLNPQMAEPTPSSLARSFVELVLETW